MKQYQKIGLMVGLLIALFVVLCFWLAGVDFDQRGQAQCATFVLAVVLGTFLGAMLALENRP